MSHRDKNPEPVLTEAVIRSKGANWSQSTQTTVRGDAQRVLESLVAEFGVEATLRAMDNQGFERSAYSSLVNLHHAEAQHRRTRAGAGPPEGLEGHT